LEPAAGLASLAIVDSLDSAVCQGNQDIAAYLAGAASAAIVELAVIVAFLDIAVCLLTQVYQGSQLILDSQDSALFLVLVDNLERVESADKRDRKERLAIAD
jgi:hypothetical protein